MDPVGYRSACKGPGERRSADLIGSQSVWIYKDLGVNSVNINDATLIALPPPVQPCTDGHGPQHRYITLSPPHFSPFSSHPSPHLCTTACQDWSPGTLLRIMGAPNVR